MPYQLTALSPMLETPDIEATVQFYTNVLGFKMQNYMPDMSWVALNFNSIQIMFALPNEHRAILNPIMSGSLYFNCDDVDAVWEQVKERALICYPIENFDYGMREFAIYDNNGYLLQFGKEIDNQNQ